MAFNLGARLFLGNGFMETRDNTIADEKLVPTIEIFHVSRKSLQQVPPSCYLMVCTHPKELN